MRTCYGIALVGVALLFSGVSALADSTGCTLLDSSDLVQNCGFENGTYNDSSNVAVPIDWISNAGFDQFPAFNNVRDIAHNGQFGLEIGNLDGETLAALNQTLDDVVGTTYSGSVFVDYGGFTSIDPDPGAFFDLRVGNQVVLSLDPTARNAWVQYAFSFTGTGSDLFTIEGATDPSEWFVDDVVVTSAAPTAPEPHPGYLCAVSLLSLVFLKRRAITR